MWRGGFVDIVWEFATKFYQFDRNPDFFLLCNWHSVFIYGNQSQADLTHLVLFKCACIDKNTVKISNFSI